MTTQPLTQPKHVPANTSLDEFLKYYCTDPNAERFIKDIEEQIGVELKGHVEQATELIQEQLGFANNLIDELEAALLNCTRLKDFKEAFARILEDSYFER